MADAKTNPHYTARELKRTYYAFWGFLCPVLCYISPCACKSSAEEQSPISGPDSVSLSHIYIIYNMIFTRWPETLPQINANIFFFMFAKTALQSGLIY